MRRSVRDQIPRLSLKQRTLNLVPFLPESLSGKLVSADNRWSLDDERNVASFPAVTSDEVSLFVGPLNTAGQAARWAGAASALPGVRTQSMGVRRSEASNDADATPSLAAAWHSPRWSARQARGLLRHATHLLIESGQPSMGVLYGRDFEREVTTWREAGLHVGVVLHGSDIRVPSVHGQTHPGSLFHQMRPELRQTLEDQSVGLNALLDRLALPEFVSTPDLLNYRPAAAWLPVLVDRRVWTGPVPAPQGHECPVVVHAPSKAAMKGTQQVREALLPLSDAGVIDYREVGGLSPEQLAAEFAQADIVIDQLGMGAYGVVAVEAMTLGRPVVAEVDEDVRRYIEQATGGDLPIVQANAATLSQVVSGLAQDAAVRAAIGRQSTEYATSVHSPERVADVLSRNFLRTGGKGGTDAV